jgi:hypothetical protein
MPDDRIDVSLTDFIDFAIRVGSPKQTKVAQVKTRGPYSPAVDFWKPLRELLQELHESASLSRKVLEVFAHRQTDPKKRNRYPGAVAGYVKFLGRKDVRWFVPPRGVWKPSRLCVSVNPELGLTVGCEDHVIKLYFKDERLSKQRVDLVTFLLRKQLSTARPGARFAVLDVANAKLYSNQPSGVDLMPLLMGEAASFVAIWDSIGTP